MQFNQVYQQGRPIFSFEIFPPRDDEARARLERALARLIALAPDFITVTNGALGSERTRTLETVEHLRRDFPIETAAHLTCVGSSREELAALLGRIDGAGIRNIVALRGDPPRGAAADGFVPAPDGLRFANELVEFIHRIEAERGLGPFGVAVAGYPEKHPEACSHEIDLSNLKRKVFAGADAVITQLFYDNEDYYRYVRAARMAGITVPIVPGLMPILSVHQIRTIAEKCGSRIPEELGRRLDKADGDPQKVQDVGVEHTIEQALGLLAAGVPGIHFYVMNRASHMERIMEAIR